MIIGGLYISFSYAFNTGRDRPEYVVYVPIEDVTLYGDTWTSFRIAL